jgi:hypothetical protein
MYVPNCVVTNDLLAQVMDTSDEWITQRSGIKERRVIPDTYRMLQELAQAPDKDVYIEQLYDQGMQGNIDPEMSTSDLWPSRPPKALSNTPIYRLTTRI